MASTLPEQDAQDANFLPDKTYWAISGMLISDREQLTQLLATGWHVPGRSGAF
jgi:hypothetical protein